MALTGRAKTVNDRATTSYQMEKMSQDQLRDGFEESIDALQSARNWLIILNGSALLLAASIRDAIG